MLYATQPKSMVRYVFHFCFQFPQPQFKLDARRLDFPLFFSFDITPFTYAIPEKRWGSDGETWLEIE